MKVCDCCFKDEEIKGYIVSISIEKGICECCSEESNLIELTQLKDFFSEFLSVFKYDEINGIPLTDLIESDWDIFASKVAGYIILSDIDIEIALSYEPGLTLLENPINPNIKVSYIDEIDESILFWEKLKKDLKHRRRFLTDISEMEELGWDACFNVFSTIDSTIPMYRARINLEGLTTPYDIAEMSSPPETKTTAGRANPQGIPYLYLSRDLRTTLYESRATFLDYVSIGEFKIDEGLSLSIVDFTKKLSPFNEMGNIINFTKGKFIRKVISQDLSKPMLRYDSELEYIPTQFICEYIRFFTSPAVGIQFNSSLDKEGINFVLFDGSNIKCVDVNTHQITKIDIDSNKIS
jgi:hypothetical protein